MPEIPLLSVYCNEADAFFARLATQPSPTVKARYDRVFKTLKASGTFSKLDCLYMLAMAPDATTARTNLMSRNYTCTVTGSPTYTQGSGYTGTGVISDYLDTNFNPTTAVSARHIVDSASVGVTTTNSSSSATQAYIGAGNALYCYILGRHNADSNTYWNNNIGADQNFLAPGTLTGTWINTRSTGDSAGYLYKDGVLIGGPSGSTPTLLSNINFRILSLGGTNTSTSTISMGFIGGGLNETDRSALATISGF